MDPVQRRPRVYFSDRGNASFVRCDHDWIKGWADVRRHSFRSKPWTLPFHLIADLFRAIVHGRWSDLVICHFAGWNALMPLLAARLLHRPSFLFVQGTGCVSFPGIGYGNFRKWPLSQVTRWCFRWARTIVAVDPSLIRLEQHYSDLGPVQQGISVFCPNALDHVVVVPYGFPAEYWPLGASTGNTCITVAGNAGEKRVRVLKGVDLVLEMAKRMPEVRFVLVGGGLEDRTAGLPNVQVRPWLSRDELVQEYGKARFSLQPSVSEGFGCVLAEAMLCGCVPVVSSAGSLPNVAGPGAAIIPVRELDVAVEVLRKVIADWDEMKAAGSREHIRTEYPLEKRWKALEALFGEALQRSQ